MDVFELQPPYTLSLTQDLCNLTKDPVLATAALRFKTLVQRAKWFK